ncbi:tigger transposable element-derived protein 1-like [Homarus americanus]|uniref:tigger transposable element-derived protein 1-like n=1 Tax=Homarus americanus TaxID=6706 RepID=UPI001C47F1FA|nr:tigger transposable element-derived protein 1-like [Homarus americanus]
MIKPGLLYRSANPRGLKGKNKNPLPVFWQSNKKAWLTVQAFLDWFQKCFIPEVEKYLAYKNMEFKVPLLIDNAQGQAECLQFRHPGVEVVFLPSNTTAVIQPLDQGVIRTFKVYYTRCSFGHIRSAMDADPDLDVSKCWKENSIAHCLTSISEAFNELEPDTENACWKTLWPECVNNVHNKRGEGFVDLVAEDVEELIDGHGKKLTEEDLEELVKSAEEDEEEDIMELQQEGLGFGKFC